LITVREAMRLPALKDAVLVAGLTGLDRVISSVNIMEVPDIFRFVKKDEFLVTTTYPIKDNVEAQERLIPGLVEKDVAALAIKPVFYGNEVPKVMIDHANKLGFPVIQLPRTASFNEILNPILGEILNRQAVLLRRKDEVHRNLADIVLRGGSLGDIASALSRLENAPVSIHTSELRLLAYHSSTPFEDGGNSEETIRVLCDDAAALKSAIGGRRGQIEISFDNTNFCVFVQPVTVAADECGLIIVWTGPGKLPDSNVTEQAATVVAMEFIKMRAVSEVERRFRSSFIQDIINGRIKSRTDVLARGEAYGWDLSPAFVPLLIEVDNHMQNEAERVKAFRRLWNVVSLITSYHEGAIAIDIGTRIMVMLRAGKERKNDSDNPQNFAKKIQEQLSLREGLTVSVGIGRRFADIMKLGDALPEAIQALEIGQLLNGSGSITQYDNLGVYRVLFSSRDNPELARFSGELLGGLIESDRLYKSELMRTLEVILRCNFNLKEAARELFIHYNTLRYRVSKIEEIAGVDLSAAEDRLNLQVAYRILQMQKARS